VNCRHRPGRAPGNPLPLNFRRLFPYTFAFSSLSRHLSPMRPLHPRKSGVHPHQNAPVVPISPISVLALSPLFSFNFQLVPIPVPNRLHSILFLLNHFPPRTEKTGEGVGGVTYLQTLASQNGTRTTANIAFRSLAAGGDAVWLGKASPLEGVSYRARAVSAARYCGSPVAQALEA
jgi:hypothetical protein